MHSILWMCVGVLQFIYPLTHGWLSRPFWLSRIRDSIETKCRVMFARRWGAGGNQEQLLHEAGFPFGGRKCFGARWRWWSPDDVNILNATELFTLRWLIILWYGESLKKKSSISKKMLLVVLLFFLLDSHSSYYMLLLTDFPLRHEPRTETPPRQLSRSFFLNNCF